MDNKTPTQGLRERKKTKTKALIQEQALKLFAAQGYNTTTVEQIAQAAEVSPSTFFRYFQTKEAVVLYDSLDPVILNIFKQQPKGISVIRALRNAMQQAFASVNPERLALEMQRFNLVRTVPELRMTMFDEMIRNIDMMAIMIAERTGHGYDDLAVRNLAGAIIGVGMAALLQAHKQPQQDDSVQSFDAALARLEVGLAL